MAPSQPVMRLTDVGEAIRRRWLVVLASVVVVLIGAYGLVTIWPEKYSATAIVSVSPITPDPFSSGSSSPQQINMATEQEVVRSTGTATDAAERLDNGTSPRALVDAVSVTSPSDSQILQISFSAGTASKAADGANAFADAYLESRVTSAGQLADRIIDTLEERIDQLVEQLDEDASAESLAGAAVQEQIVELRQQQSSLVTVTLNPGRIIEQAMPPSSPSAPGLAVMLAGGLVGGLLIGVALALLRDRSDRRVTHAERLRDLIGGLVIDGTADPDHDEPYRHTVLELTRSHPRKDTDRPVLVALVGPADGRVYEAAASLVDVARSHRMRAQLIDSDRMDMSAVDAGWPADADVVADWSGEDLVVLDLTMITSRTRRTAVALRCDAVIVVAAKRTRRQPIHEFTQQLRAAGRRVDLGLLLPDSSRRKSTRTFAAPDRNDENGTQAQRARTRADESDQPTGWPASTGQPGRG